MNIIGSGYSEKLRGEGTVLLRLCPIEFPVVFWRIDYYNSSCGECSNLSIICISLVALSVLYFSQTCS